MLYANYHAHTYRCGHTGGNYADEDYVRSAIEGGLHVLGFSDHSPWPYVKTGGIPPHSRIRMLESELPGYIDSINELKEKYKGRIRIYTGLECEYYPDYIPWLKEQMKKLDYIILGNHWTPSEENGEVECQNSVFPDQLWNYTKYTVLGMQTGLYRYLAHPDVIFTDYQVFDDTCKEISYVICKEAKALGLPIEYNLNGIDRARRGVGKGLRYPNRNFWEIAAEVGCVAIIGSDAHRPEQLNVPELIKTSMDYLDSLGIKCLKALEGLEE